MENGEKCSFLDSIYSKWNYKYFRETSETPVITGLFLFILTDNQHEVELHNFIL
jgi:hypothetical protein